MRTCKNCQFSLRSEARFCPECGVPVPILCSACGAAISANAKFCGECGTSVKNTDEGVILNNYSAIGVETIANGLEHLNITIESATATGPDKNNEFYLQLKFKVSNVTKKIIQSINVSTQIFNQNGIIVAEDKNSFDEVIKPNGSAKFENYVHSVKAELLGNEPEKLHILLNVCAAEVHTTKFLPFYIPDQFYEIVSNNLNPHDGKIKILASSVWKSKAFDEEDPRIEAKICIQNLSKDYIPEAKLSLEVLDKDEETLDDRDSYEVLIPGGYATISVETQIPNDKSVNCQANMKLDLYRQVAQGFTQFSGVDIEEAEVEEDDEENGDSKRIYIKTEPGGKVIFGPLNEEQTTLLLESIKLEEMPEELLDLRYNNDGDFVEYAGVINDGEDGDAGNEGIIRTDVYDPVEIPKAKDGKLKNGAYLVYLSLSKVSIEFEFEPNDGNFDSDKFSEISVPIKLPDFIEHNLYGHPSFNIVVGYQYDGNEIEEYDGDLVDRGYDDLTVFLLVKEGKPSLAYKNYNGEESWADSGFIVKAVEAGQKKSIEEVLTALYDDSLHLFQKGYFKVQYKGNDFKAYQEDGSYSGSFLTLIHHILFYEKLYEDYFSEDTLKVVTKVIKNSPDLPPAFEDETENDYFDELVYDATEFTYQYMREHKLYSEEMNSWIKDTDQDWEPLVKKI